MSHPSERSTPLARVLDWLAGLLGREDASRRGASLAARRREGEAPVIEGRELQSPPAGRIEGPAPKDPDGDAPGRPDEP